jgi:hypothetical protein
MDVPGVAGDGLGRGPAVLAELSFGFVAELVVAAGGGLVGGPVESASATGVGERLGRGDWTVDPR